MHNNYWLSMTDTNKVISNDIPLNAIKGNAEQAYLALNLHCGLVEELCGRTAARILRYRYLRDGIVATTGRLNDIFKAYLQALNEASPDDDEILVQFDLDDDLAAIVATYLVNNDDGEYLRHVSQITRFMKRFTYDLPDTNEVFDKFIVVNSRCISESDYRSVSGPLPDSCILDVKGLHVPGPTVCGMVADEIYSLIGDAPHNLYEVARGSFSGGATAEGYHTLGERILAVAEYAGSFEARPVGSRGYHRVSQVLTGRDWRWWCDDERCWTPRGIQVPKTLTSKRLIAPEPTPRAYRSSMVLDGLRAALRRTHCDCYINEHDQSVNRNLARTGAAGGRWCTLDLSSASDTVSRLTAFRVFPLSWRPYLADAVSDYIMLGDRKVKVRCLSTSGNKITWLCEAIYFLAIARVASRLAGCDARSCYAYGDDIIVDESAYDTVTNMLECFGHCVNGDKSYARGLFRESCGGDYAFGYDITPRYWPRRIVDPKDPTFPKTLTELQHQLYEYPSCRYFLNEYVMKLVPKITFSPVGADCDDLWDGAGEYTGYHCKMHTKYKRKPNAVHSLEHPEIVQSNYVWNFGKTTVTSTYTADRWPAQYEEWQYYSFLKYGPRYNSPEDEAWGISTPYLSLADWDPSPTTKFR